MAGRWETKKVLIVVRTYPVPASKGAEVSCTAAITEQGNWLRLFPIPYRFLSSDKRFEKYQWIEVEITKASDSRPESYTLNVESIKIVGRVPPGKKWGDRKKLLFPLRSDSLCELKRLRDRDKHPTLGLFRPKKIKRFIIEPDRSDWTAAERSKLEKPSLFGRGPKVTLEKIPYKFSYEFCCEDAACTGHKCMCTDWEMAAAWRKWRDKYGDKWEPKFRQRFDTEMIKKYDTHFFVGNTANHPTSWIIVGLFYPPPEKTPRFEPLSLFLD